MNQNAGCKDAEWLKGAHVIIRICTFTKQGEDKTREVFDNWQEMIPQYREGSVSLGQWTGECFQKHLPILFVGACGIAVRAVAPYVKDKLNDSAVLVMDEKGEFVIPILSGHVGGANELAQMISKRAGATPVITTATDVEGMFSADVFAVKNGLRIVNREGIREISGKLLRGEEVSITWEDEISASGKELPSGLKFVPFDMPHADIRIVTKETAGTCSLLLEAKEFILGIGCKKGKTFEELQSLLDVDWEKISAIASIDLKAKEEGLWELAQFHHLPFMTFSAKKLEEVEGDYTKSEFEREITGTDNVCERAALCLAGPGGELVKRKTAENGMTFAVAKRKIRLSF
ncbi:MAG: cobalamin biosynthesis protein [Lachnospiraceae bacterium]|nr:cobalamin biosynthesis protein [Lachnospiraceae bacterium]